MLRWTLLGLLLVSPYFLAIASRRQALRDGASGWFAFLQRIQWIAIAYIACWASAYLGLGGPVLAPWLASHGLAAWATAVTIVSLAIPIVAFQVFAGALIQGVNRAIRGAEVSEREVLAESLRSLVGIGVVFLALCGTLVAMTYGLWRLALGTALAGILGGPMLASPPHRRTRFAPLAVTHGELRDRLFALAARAGVRVKQLYVVPLARTRIANAVAVQGESVMVTDYLLTHLTRDELDAVLAHELAHLRRRHPALLAATLIVSGTVTWLAYAVVGSGVAGLIAFITMILTFMAVSRRFEYAADAGALSLGIRPEALITGLCRLARINHMPQDWSRLREWTLTHPSNRRRAQRIARHGHVPVERIESLMNESGVVSDRYDVPAQVHEDRLFTTTFKAAVLQRNAWAMLFANATASALFAALVGSMGHPSGLRALGFIPAGVLAFAATFGLTQYLAMRPYRGLRSRSWSRRRGRGLDRESHTTLWVGLSPDSEPRLYEGLATWDVGFLTLDSDRLVYRGEEASFSLTRDEIEAVDFGPRFPSWVPVFGVAMRWRRGETKGGFTLLPVQASGLISYAAEAHRMRRQVEDWRSGTADESISSGPSASEPIPIATPPTGPVTGMAPHEVIKPLAVLVTVFLQLAISAAIALWIGPDLAPRGGLGVIDAMGASVIAYLLLITPLLRARRAGNPALAPELRKAA